MASKSHYLMCFYELYLSMNLYFNHHYHEIFYYFYVINY